MLHCNLKIFLNDRCLLGGSGALIMSPPFSPPKFVVVAVAVKMGVSMFFHCTFSLKLAPDWMHLHSFKTLIFSTKTRFIRTVSMATLFWNRLPCCHRWILLYLFLRRTSLSQSESQIERQVKQTGWVFLLFLPLLFNRPTSCNAFYPLCFPFVLG